MAEGSRSTPALAVWGTSSWAGKSLLATALCACLRRRGIRVAPFKAVNMSNNARVVAGGEIGAAQYFQALAAGVLPSIDHNPVLLKPESDTRSQVVALGQVDRSLSDMAWRDRSEQLWAIAQAAYDRVASTCDAVVIEGAGSPAEVNLADVDLANLRTARHARARAILVCDIDRGGAFAHLLGTWSLLEATDRNRIAGFVLNKFRGDPALLAPAPATLEQLTGIPMIGVVPMTRHGLPDEDGADPAPSQGHGRRVRIVRAPAASNLDEWWALRESSECQWVTTPSGLADAELIVLPGSKLPSADLAWLRAGGLDSALIDAYRRGVPILAVCGGAQMLGETLVDPHGMEAPGTFAGLGLIPAVTSLGASKRVQHKRACFRDDLPAPWTALRGLQVEGYEIHYGNTTAQPPIQAALKDGTGWVNGPVLATYVHGLCENPQVIQALVGTLPPRSLAEILDGLADLAEQHLDMDAVVALLERRPAPE